MKRILLLIAVTILPLIGYSQYYNNKADIQHTFCADGFWGEWESNYGLIPKITNNGFILYIDGTHPSEWVMKAEFIPDANKKRIKARYKAKEWENISCTVTFRTQHGDLKKAMQLDLTELGPNPKNGYCQKIERKGQIWIAPYKIKKGMRIFNIWVEGYGLGIAFNKITMIMNKYY